MFPIIRSVQQCFHLPYYQYDCPSPSLFLLMPLPQSSNQVPKLPHLIIGKYHSLLPLLKSLSELLEKK